MTPEEEKVFQRKLRRSEYYRTHRAEALAYQKEYNRKNRDRIRAYQTEYQKSYRAGNTRRDPNKDSEE